MDDALKPRLKQDVSSGTPLRGVFSFVKLFFGQAKKAASQGRHRLNILFKRGVMGARPCAPLYYSTNRYNFKGVGNYE